MKARTLIPALLITFAASGCATWDNLSSREKSAATGAAVGGVAGAVVSNGGILGTVGGAAIGGVIGDQVGKKKSTQRPLGVPPAIRPAARHPPDCLVESRSSRRARPRAGGFCLPADEPR